jgi:hypothetical protein
MNTGSRDEQIMLADIHRIASALERLANLAEEQVYGVTAPNLDRLKRQMAREAAEGTHTTTEGSST